MTATASAHQEAFPAHSARIYDYLLGGKDNYAIDRRVAAQLTGHLPDLPRWARANRTCRTRVVRYLAGQGITRFLDLGAGLPDEPNTHETAKSISASSRVVYVDNDPIVASHGRSLLSDGSTVVIEADIRDPDEVFEHGGFRWLIDPDGTLPVAVLMFGVLHCIPDADKPAEIVRAFMERMPAGSFLVISHGLATEETVAAAESCNLVRVVPRGEAAIRELFGSAELVEPGLVPLPEWRPSGPVAADDAAMPWLCGVART